MPESEARRFPAWAERERDHYELATITSEVMYALLEAEYKQGERDLDTMMRRLKDLSAYSLLHAEILEQREGVELLALAKLFGATTDPRFRQNQARLTLLSEETVAYQGQAEVIEQEVAARKASRRGQKRGSDAKALQPHLL